LRQVQLLQQALSVQCTKDVPLPKTTEKICTLIEQAFAMGDIKADLLCCIALLHSLSDNFPHAQSIISHDIAALTDAAPYGSKDIHLFLENEQSLLENDHHNDSRSHIALTAQSKNSSPTNVPICENSVCGKRGHTKAYCIKPGGSMAGKTVEESKAACKAAREKKPLAANPPKIPITVKDINGHVFTVMVDSDTTPSPASEFAGLASDPIPTASTDMDEYESWVIIEEEPTTTVNWNGHTSTPIDSTLTVEPLNQMRRSVVTTHDFPFIIDSGAMVHISPKKSDFLNLHPIPP
ncbi:hypothetical protein L208DRAFT_1551817, partial [Tricholoma matsutake]